MQKYVQIGIVLFAFSVSGVAQNVTERVAIYLAEFEQNNTLTTTDKEFEIVSEHISSTSGIHHIYFVQTINGLPIIGTESSVHFDNNGKLVWENVNFVRSSSGKVTGRPTQAITPIDAIRLGVVSLNYRNNAPFRIIKQEFGNTAQALISDGGIFRENILAKLKYYRTKNDELLLVWDFVLKEKNDGPFWNIKIDATSKTIVLKENMVFYCYIENDSGLEESVVNYNFNPYEPDNIENCINDEKSSCTECYEAFILPLENPYYGTRSIVVNPADPLASPFGWHDVDGFPGPDFTTTQGNNTNVSTYGGYVPDGGQQLDFSHFPLNINSTLNNRSEAAVATNVFYVLNSLHDILYQYGFNEVAGNFQENNYGNGGLDQDSVTVFAQLEGRCGSAYYPAYDGTFPRIFYGICSDHDPSIDSDVLIHEYVHGLTTRMVFGGGSSCLRNAENLGEGFSDWYAKVITIKQGDRGEDPTGIGNYALGQGPDGKGTHQYYYSTDMEINPLTYLDVPNDYRVHVIGAIWATILWEITWELIDEYGFDPNVYNYTGTEQDAGNIRALAIVTEALKIMPCSPGFIDARDAILRANQLLYFGESDCYLWDAFAKRGLGLYAFQGSADEIDDQTVDFTTMPREIEFNLNAIVCLNDPYAVLDGGLPYGGKYNGVGVIDNGDGRTFRVNADGLLPGEYEVIYRIEDSNCYTASSKVGYYYIEEDTEPPYPTCPLDFTHLYPKADVYFLWDYTSWVVYTDNCSFHVAVTQIPEPNTIVEPGYITLDFTLEDEQGNISYCSTTLNLEVHIFDINGDESYEVIIYPNPNSGIVYIQNLSIEKIKNATVYDVMGRVVKYYNLNKTEIETELNMESLVTGVYFIRFEFENNFVVKQIIRK